MTNTDYSKLSDEQINQIATCKEFKLKGWKLSDDGKSFCIDSFTDEYQSVVDYCNDWSAMGPLISKYKISIVFNEGKASAVGDGLIVFADNPKRAAAIVFLEMGECYEYRYIFSGA